MCGIIAYCGGRTAEPILLEGLKRLEYRGYDSAGLALADHKQLVVIRAVGKVSDLEKKLLGQNLAGKYGIAHTRWATHGRPSEQNAHPHSDCRSKISIAHNGIIENYQELKEELIAKKHMFTSETDSEVVAHLIEENFNGDLEMAVLKTVKRLEGTFGLAVLHADIDRQIVLVKRGSPIIVGIGEKEYFAASDANALLPYTSP
jgi:glucosamine--fructose-6-phosphate aminotransferase (isomerizing)